MKKGASAFVPLYSVVACGGSPAINSDLAPPPPPTQGLPPR